jgi:hypothetical protein
MFIEIVVLCPLLSFLNFSQSCNSLIITPNKCLKFATNFWCSFLNAVNVTLTYDCINCSLKKSHVIEPLGWRFVHVSWVMVHECYINRNTGSSLHKQRTSALKGQWVWLTFGRCLFQISQRALSILTGRFLGLPHNLQTNAKTVP